jgi:hypothetical protein
MDNRYQKGQSTIEFIITFAFGLSLIFVVFNSAINYATGYLVHYATFMASRVYLTADNHTGTIGFVNPSLSGAQEKASNAFLAYNLGVFKISDANFKINRVEDVSGSSQNMTVGAITIFEQAMDVIGRVAGQKKLELVSESFLGKEPTRAECATRVCFGVTGLESCDGDMDITLYDNGC